MGTVYLGVTPDGDRVAVKTIRQDLTANDEAKDRFAREILVTLHRFKGLEYQRMILAGITDAVVPGYHIAGDQVRQRRELMRARSLLFVAATRARDTLVISWHGQPSRFLPKPPGQAELTSSLPHTWPCL